MVKKKPIKNHQTLHLPYEIREILKADAAADQRSVSAYVARLIKAAHGAQGGKP